MLFRKAISILVAAALVFSFGICAYADDVAEGETLEVNENRIQVNNGTIVTNNNVIYTNKGTVTTNNYSVVINAPEGTVTTNDDMVNYNYGTVTTNDDLVYYNYGTVTTNDGYVSDNYGTVTTNDGYVNDNYGTVTTNNGIVFENYGTVIDEYGTIHYGVTYAREDGSIIRNESMEKGTEITVAGADEGYIWFETNAEEEYTGGENIIVDAVKWFVQMLFPEGSDPSMPAVSDNSDSNCAVELRVITHTKGRSKNLPTGIKADSADVQVKLSGAAITGFEVIDGEVVLSADFLETLSADGYALCISVGSVQHWLILMVQ